MQRAAMNEQTLQPQLCMRLPHPSGANEQGVLGVLPGILLAGRRSTEILFHLLFPSDWMSLLETFANYHGKYSKNWSKEELNQIVGGKGLLRVSSGCTSPWHGVNNHRSNEGTQPSTGAVGHDVIQVNAIQSRVAPDLHVTVIYPQSPWWLWALPLCALPTKPMDQRERQALGISSKKQTYLIPCAPAFSSHSCWGDPDDEFIAQQTLRLVCRKYLQLQSASHILETAA